VIKEKHLLRHIKFDRTIIYDYPKLVWWIRGECWRVLKTNNYIMIIW